jgi:hypothetical protein
MKKIFNTLLIIAAVSNVAQAELVVRGSDAAGNQLIYDTTLDITWYDFRFGTDSWPNVVAWADALVVDFGGNSYADWRLPQALPVNGVGYDYNWSTNGSTDIGKNITSPNAELSHLFFVTLGNSAVDDEDYFPGIHNHGPFVSLEDWYYWYGTEYAGPPANGDIDTDGDGQPDAYHDTRGFFFLFYNGFQDSWGRMSNIGMAVRDGDVAPVPVPAAAWLLGSGLLGLFGIRRRSRQGDTAPRYG